MAVFALTLTLDLLTAAAVFAPFAGALNKDPSAAGLCATVCTMLDSVLAEDAVSSQNAGNCVNAFQTLLHATLIHKPASPCLLDTDLEPFVGHLLVLTIKRWGMMCRSESRTGQLGASAAADLCGLIDRRQASSKEAADPAAKLGQPAFSVQQVLDVAMADSVPRGALSGPNHGSALGVLGALFTQLQSSEEQHRVFAATAGFVRGVVDAICHTPVPAGLPSISATSQVGAMIANRKQALRLLVECLKGPEGSRLIGSIPFTGADLLSFELKAPDRHWCGPVSSSGVLPGFCSCACPVTSSSVPCPRITTPLYYSVD